MGQVFKEREGGGTEYDNLAIYHLGITRDYGYLFMEWYTCINKLIF